MNEAFLKAQRAYATYDANLPFRRWILGIARNQCMDMLRKRRRENLVFKNGAEREWAEPGGGPLTQLLCEERREAVRTAVADLPESYRVPLTLRYFEELTYDEIAAALDLTRQNVAVLLFRAKQRLRRALGAQGESHGL